MRKTLTSKTVENLKPLPDLRHEVRDTLLPGFGVRVSVTGRKSWFAVGRVGGRQRRHTIGNYPTVSLAEAREAARLILKDIQLGSYAPAKVDAAPLLPTLGQTIHSFIELYAKPKDRGWKDVRATFRKFDSLVDRPIAELTRADIVKVLESIAAAGAPVAANRAMSAIKKLFAWSIDRGTIAVHPLVGLRKPGLERSRDRLLTDEEILSFWKAAEALGFPFGPAFQLMALTGQRRGEVATMRWSQIDLPRAIWTIPASVSKNGRAHEVPLSSLAENIVEHLPRFADSDLVFTTTGASPISGFGRAKDRLDFMMETSDWRLHDLRRTAASGMARAGIAPHVIEKVLNHVSGQISGVAAVYNRHGYQTEKAEALEVWAKEIQALVHGRFRRPHDMPELISSASEPLDGPFHTGRPAQITSDPSKGKRRGFRREKRSNS
jgi:integrase